MSDRGAARRRGKPNRGGGRFNKPQNSSRGRGGAASRGAGRGGGRGRGQARGTQNQGGGGLGGRKGGANAFALGELGDAVLQAKEEYDEEDYYYESHRPQRRRGGPDRRVNLQHVHMSLENQDMVKDMLTELHGGDGPEPTSEDMYEELDWRADNHYWTGDSKLVVEDLSHNAQEYEDNSQPKTPVFTTLAVNRLQRYGFEKVRCEEALTNNDGDIGLSLEDLLSQCFNLQLHKPPPNSQGDDDYEDDDYTENGDESEAKGDLPWDEIMEQRTEEKLALESIYGEAFCEKIPNKIWTVALDLAPLTKLAEDAFQSDKGERRQRAVAEQKARNRGKMCHFYQKGDCRFGSKCKFVHEIVYEAVDSYFTPVSHIDDENLYDLEIRFPENNSYPLELPFIAFYSRNDLVPNNVCLSITARLMREAREMLTDSAPCVFSLVSVLDDEVELNKCFEQHPHEFSLPKPLIYRSTQSSVLKKSKIKDTNEANNYLPFAKEITPPDQSEQGKVPGNAKSAKSEPLNDETQRRSYAKKDGGQRKLSAADVAKMNRNIKERFSRKQDSGAYLKMLAHRKGLPAWGKKDSLLSCLIHNQVVVVSGMTGCGKTTQVPQFILDHYMSQPGSTLCHILCTQPRRISAMAVAERVAEERTDKLGETVGYQIRLQSVMSSRTRLLFCTTGILLRRLESDPTLTGITHVLIDEVHERSEESDFLMMVLRDLLPSRHDLKLILMSATMNADLFSEYFGGCPVIDIPGRTFPVHQIYLEEAIEMTRYQVDERSPYARPLKRANAVRSGITTRASTEDIEDDLDNVNMEGVPPRDNIHDENLSPKQLALRYPDCRRTTVKCLAIMDHEKINNDLVEAVLEWTMFGNHQYPKDGAVLVFLPGLAEITSLYEQLLSSSTFGGRNKSKYRIIPLHSTLSSEDQHAVFSRPPQGITKIVLATNIAETSITIEDVLYVVDCGRMKEKRYDPSKGMESLELVWVSQANALQRKGRAGRVAAGVCVHLFSSHRYNYQLKPQPIPEIQRVPLEQMVLKIKLLDTFQGMSVESVLGKVIEPPASTSIQSAVSRLQDLGAVDTDKNLTPLGYHLAFLPVDVRIGKLMLYGSIFRCLDAALTVAATLSYRSPFVAPFDKKTEADQKKSEFALGNSDHLTVLNAYRAWIEVSGRGNHASYHFCQENFLSIKTMQMLGSMKRQFAELLSDIGFVKSGLTVRSMERMCRGGGDGVLAASGPEANTNSDNQKLLAAILVAALYPNVVQVLTPEAKYTQTSEGAVPKMPRPEEIKLKTKSDGYVFLHPSSVNFQVRYYESPYLVYHEKVKTSKVFIRDCTMVSVYPLLLFGGGAISIDLDKGNFVISVDEGWIRFRAASHQVAELVRELRLELEQLMQDKIEKPELDLCSCPRGSRIIPTIVKLFSTQ